MLELFSSSLLLKSAEVVPLAEVCFYGFAVVGIAVAIALDYDAALHMRSQIRVGSSICTPGCGA